MLSLINILGNSDFTNDKKLIPFKRETPIISIYFRLSIHTSMHIYFFLSVISYVITTVYIRA